jgi:hypothetical protein
MRRVNRQTVASPGTTNGDMKVKTFKVWLIAGQKSLGAYAYVSRVLPKVGETIFVRKTVIDEAGDATLRMETSPVLARVTRVRAGIITADEMPE